LVKKSSGVGDWYLQDNMRGWPVSGDAAYLLANSSAAEGQTSQIYPNATGFSTLIGSGDYIYIAIRRGPMKVPTSGTSVFSPNIATISAGAATLNVTTNFPVDLSLSAQRGGGSSTAADMDRLRGGSTSSYFRLTTSSTAAQNSGSGVGMGFDSNTALKDNWWNSAGGNIVYWNFRRAPSFFDEVCYTGTGGASQTFTHNLGVAPELVIVKNRDSAAAWESLGTALSSSQRQIYLNRTQAGVAVASGHLGWNGTDGAYKAPTSSVVYFGGDSDVGGSGVKYVAYLFATCASVSKVGNYTGTATTLQIDCGFTGGARFVLIKRTDSTGDWYVWDSARGIIAGNDPYLLLNSTAAEVTSTDYIDTYSAGFEISSTAPAAINASGGTFIFLAIA
jgi:hypothetical protein